MVMHKTLYQRGDMDRIMVKQEEEEDWPALRIVSLWQFMTSKNLQNNNKKLITVANNKKKKIMHTEKPKKTKQKKRKKH